MPVASPRWRLLALVVALIVARAVDQVLFYRLAVAMDGYGLYFSTVILPVGFLVVLWPLVLYRIYTGTVTKEMLRFPTSKLAVLGIFDSLYNLLSTWPVPAIGGPVSNVLSQAVVPINMGLSTLVMRTGFTRLHYVGAFLAVYGVLVRLIPSFLGDEEGGGASSPVVYAVWCVVMVGSQVPAALSNVYKEAALKGAERLDVWYTNAVISTYQLGFGLLLVPTAGIPGSPDFVELSALPQYVADATTCFMGASPNEGDHCEDEALSGVVLFCAFLVFNVAYNLLSLAVMQEGSSALFVVASAVRLPLVDILLLWPWLAGLAAASFTAFDGFALVALLLAMYLYNADPEVPSDEPPRGLGELARIAWGAVRCSCLAPAADCFLRSSGGRSAGAGSAEGLRLVAAAAAASGDGSSDARDAAGFYGAAGGDTASEAGLSLAVVDGSEGAETPSVRRRDAEAAGVAFEA